jgi:hypothetical protein
MFGWTEQSFSLIPSRDVVVALTIFTKRNKNLRIVTSNQQNKPGVNIPKDQSQFID